MAWTCEQTEDRLLDALDGNLDSAERALLDAHLADCAKCRQLAVGVRQTVEALHHLPPVEPAPWLVPKIIERTSGIRPVHRFRWFGWLDSLAQPRFALGVVAVLVSLSILLRALSGGAPSSLAALNPLQLYRQVDRRAHLVYARSVKFISDLRVVYEIQSRFQPEPAGEPAQSPEKKSTDQLEQLFYNRVESRLRPVANPVLGDKHEMRYPS
jgi:anti-sigma factor RsiW